MLRVGRPGRVAALGADPALVDVEARCRRRRRPPRGARPSARSIPRSENASRRAHASQHELREVGRAFTPHRRKCLADLECVADGTAERLVHVGEQADDRLPARWPSSSISAASTRASSSVFMNAPSPTLTSSTIASAPAAIFFDMIEAAISGRSRRPSRSHRGAHTASCRRGRAPAVCPTIAIPTARAERTNSAVELDAIARESTRACRASHPYDRGSARSSCRTGPRTRRQSARPRSTPCRRPHPSNACRQPCGRVRRGRATRRFEPSRP